MYNVKFSLEPSPGLLDVEWQNMDNNKINNEIWPAY